MANVAPRPHLCPTHLAVVAREVGECELDDAGGAGVVQDLVVVLDGDDDAVAPGLEPAVVDLQGLVDAGDGDGGLGASVLHGLPERAVFVVQLDQYVDGDVLAAVGAAVVVDVGVAAGEHAVPTVEGFDVAAALVAEAGGLEQLVHVLVGHQHAGVDLLKEGPAGVVLAAVGGLGGRGRLGRRGGSGSVTVVVGGVARVGAVAAGHEDGACDDAGACEQELSSIHGFSQ